MGSCNCQDAACSIGASRDRERRRVLWVVLLLNAALFVGEFGAGLWARSSALQADSLDGLGDALVYALSLMVVGESLRQRAGAALAKGLVMAMFGLVVMAGIVHRAIHGSEPLAPVMAVAATVALVVNLACFALLYRFRADDVNMRSVWLCSRNDIVNNAGVLVAAGAVTLLGSRWPDIAVGALVAALFLHTAFGVIRESWPLWRGHGSDLAARWSRV